MEFGLIEIGLAILVPVVTFILGNVFRRSYKLGRFEFTIKIKGMKELEEENATLIAENEALKLKAGIVQEAWTSLAKKQLCEDCKNEEK